MSDERDDRLRRLAEIQRARRVRSIGGALTWIAVGQLFFAAFAFGHSRGPVPLRPIELLAGMGLALIFGSVLAVGTTRRRLENTSQLVLRLTEGRHRRRIAVFQDFFTIDQEVVLGGTVERIDRNDERMTIRYLDPRFDGPVLREFAGHPSPIEKLCAELQTMKSASAPDTA